MPTSRRWVAFSVAATCATLVVAALLEILPGDGDLIVFVVAPVFTFLCGRSLGFLAGAVLSAAVVIGLEVAVAVRGGAFVPGLMLPATGWFAGQALRRHDLTALELAERARELEEEREAHAALSVRYERARIASELHDIVAHAISVMVVQAGAGQRLAARDPELTRETFDAIAGAAQQAEADMGRLVALLGDDRAVAAAPDLDLVSELVARAAGSGLDVTLRLEGSREGLPSPVVHAAYRVVQEGLTNALRYAAGAAVRVTVSGGAAGLDVEVLNGPASVETGLGAVGTGNGLRGLRERVGACGGTLSAGPEPDGGWRLAARLPRRIPARSAG